MITQTKRAIEGLKRAGLNHRNTKTQNADFRVRTSCNSHGEFGKANITIYDSQKAISLTDKILENGFDVTHIIINGKVKGILIEESYRFTSFDKDSDLIVRLNNWDLDKEKLTERHSIVKEITIKR